VRSYTHDIVKPEFHPPAIRTVAGNTEERAAQTERIKERAAQIERIKERLDRLGGSAHQVAAELVVLAREIKTLTASEDAPNAGAFRSRKQDN
jgi:hypothetical protein